MYEITYTLPESKHTKSRLLKLSDEKAELYEIIRKFFRVSQRRKHKVDHRILQ